MMTDNELRRLARYIVQEQANNEEWMMAYAKAQAKSKKPEQRLVSAKVAADMIGISVWQLYRIKDDVDGVPQFSYIKSGASNSSTLKFNAATIQDEYARYVASKRKEIRLTPVSRAVI